MSGIELVGLAASVLQIADLGWKVSYKLYAFSTRVHDTGKSIELISQDISATGAILKQLGDAVEEDEEAKPASRLCSQGLIDAAGKLVKECKDLFKEIDLGISGSGKGGNKVVLGFRQKLKWSYLEPRVELLRMNLERLKSSLAIMLNVLIYAEQLRSRKETIVIAQQQTLVASFFTRKADMEKKIAHINKTIVEETGNQPSEPTKEIMQGSGVLSPDEAVREHLNEIRTKPRPYLLQTKAVSLLETNAQNVPTTHPPTSGESSRTNRFTHLEQHRQLIEKLLEEVNSSRYAVDHGVRYRLHDGVLDLHWQEWSPLRHTHGDEVLRGLLAQNPILARYWHERTSKTGDTQMAGAIAAVVGSVGRQRKASPRDGMSQRRSASKVTESVAIVAAGLGNAAMSDVYAKGRNRSRTAGARDENPTSRSASRLRSAIHKQSLSSPDDSLRTRMTKHEAYQEPLSAHDVSSDSDGSVRDQNNSTYEDIFKGVDLPRGSYANTAHQDNTRNSNSLFPAGLPNPLLTPDEVPTHANGSIASTGDHNIHYGVFNDDIYAEAAAGLAAMQAAEEQEAARRWSGSASLFSAHGSNRRSQEPPSTHDVSSDSDYATVDMGLIGGGYAGHMHYGEQPQPNYASAVAMPSASYHVSNQRMGSVRSAGVFSEGRDSQTSGYETIPTQEAVHPFPPFRTDLARVDTAGTGGLTEPSPHLRRLSFEDGDEDGLLEIDNRLSGAFSPSRDSFQDLSYHPGMSPQRPLPPAPSISDPGSRLPPLIPTGTYPSQNRLSQYAQLPRPYPSAPDEYLLSPSQVPRSTSLSSTRSAPKPDQPIRTKNDAKARAMILRAQASCRPMSDVYEASTPHSAVSLDLPTIPRKKFNPSKLSTEQFKKCPEPWALSSVVENTRTESTSDTIADLLLLQWTTVSPTSVSGNLQSGTSTMSL